MTPDLEQRMAAKTPAGKCVILNIPSLGRGTYATVRPIEGDHATAAKLYHERGREAYDRTRRTKARKLEIMTAMTPPDCGEEVVVAWPTDTIRLKTSETDLCDGYLMARAPDGATAFSLLVRHGAGSARAKRAAEVARAAISRLHEQNMILGDINARNFMLDPDERVWMLDTDGWQFESEDGIHHAEGATDHYLSRRMMESLSGTIPNCVNPRCPLAGAGHRPTPSCQPRRRSDDLHAIDVLTRELLGRKR